MNLNDFGIETEKSISIGATQLADEEYNIIFKMIGPEKSIARFINQFNNHDSGQYWDLIQGVAQDYEEVFAVVDKQNQGTANNDWGTYDMYEKQKQEVTEKLFGFTKLHKRYGRNDVPVENAGYLQIELTCDGLAIPLFRHIATKYDESIFVVQYLSKKFTGFYVINVSAGLERLSGNTEVGLENGRSAVHQVYKGDDFYLPAKQEQHEWLNDFPF